MRSSVGGLLTVSTKVELKESAMDVGKVKNSSFLFPIQKLSLLHLPQSPIYLK